MLFYLPGILQFTHDVFTGVPYEVTTFTSDRSGASTDADVYIVLYGKDVCTMQKPLCTSKRERKECFKRGAVDKFIVEVWLFLLQDLIPAYAVWYNDNVVIHIRYI